MGEVGLGVGMWAPPKDRPEWKEKERLRARADYLFWIGLAVTGCGIVL